MGTDFVLVLPTVDNITDQLKALGRGAHIYTINIRAFRHIKVDGVRHIMRRHGHKFINYADDYFGLCSVRCKSLI